MALHLLPIPAAPLDAEQKVVLGGGPGDDWALQVFVPPAGVFPVEQDMCPPVPPPPVPFVEQLGEPPTGPWNAEQVWPLLPGVPWPVPPALQDEPLLLFPLYAEQLVAVVPPDPPDEQELPAGGFCPLTALQVWDCGLFGGAPPPVAEQVLPGLVPGPVAEQPAAPPAPCCELVNPG